MTLLDYVVRYKVDRTTKASCYHTNFSRHLCNKILYMYIILLLLLLFVHSVDNVEMLKKKKNCV